LLQRLAPLLTAHVDDAQIRAGWNGVRFELQNSFECGLSALQVTMRERLLALGERSRRVQRGLRKGRAT